MKLIWDSPSKVFLIPTWIQISKKTPRLAPWVLPLSMERKKEPRVEEGDRSPSNTSRSMMMMMMMIHGDFCTTQNISLTIPLELNMKIPFNKQSMQD